VELAPGTVLLGKYRIDEVIGTGGMGRVVRASHLYLQQSVAIKILLPQMAESPSTVARFLREAQATVRLKSEHIARVIDVGTMPDGIPFMVMEHLEGNDLNQILRHHGPQVPEIVCDLMLQACEGMAEAHAMGIVHRDIKPSNFYITRRPDGSMLLKILDFGISKTPVGYEELTGTQTVIGTPTYMSPEQMKSGKQTDARSDIWSMGVVMYQLLHGRPPFSGESYAELVLKVGTEPPAPVDLQLPAGLGDVILRCLEKEQKNRLQNVGELARMLAPYATDPSTAAAAAARTTRILTARHNQPHPDGRPSFGPVGFGQQGSPLAAGGGLAAPVPLSPAQLTPRSWPPSTSLSQGRGQVTHQTRGSKSWLVAGALSLAILAGAGGYIVNGLVKDDDRRAGSVVESPPAASAEPTTPEPAPADPAAAPADPSAPPADPAAPPAADRAPPTTPSTPTTTTATTTPSTPPATATPKTATVPARTPTVPVATVEPKVEPKPAVPAVPAKKAEPKPTVAKTEPKPTAAATKKAEPKPAIPKKVTPRPTPPPEKKKKVDLFDRRD